MDFGITAQEEETSGTAHISKVLGTASFMAPEQAKKNNKLDIRSDIYSLGVTFFNLLTGKLPFSGKTSLEIVLKHVNEEASKVSQYRQDVPPENRPFDRDDAFKRPK